MAYSDKFGVTDIREARDHVSLSWDYDDDMTDKAQRVACILYVPNVKKQAHEHIELSREEAIRMRDWLNEFIQDTTQ